MNSLSTSEETDIAPSEVFLDGESITEIDLESTCKSLVADMLESGDSKKVEEAILNLNGVQNLAARAKSKLIYEWSVFWKTQNPNGDFAEMYIQSHGGDKLSVQKHQAVGSLLLSPDVPDNVKKLTGKELLAPARALQSGYDLSDVWDEIAHAGSEAEVNNIIHKIKGTAPREGTMTIKVYQDGTVMGFMGSIVVNLGSLNFQDRDEETDENKKKVLEIGIARIINNTRMKSE